MTIVEERPNLSTQELAGRLGQALGSENVLTSPEDLEFYSTDIYHQREIAELVVRPRTVEQVSQAARICWENDRAMIPRGGGLSYTGGYLPIRKQTVTFDLKHMNKILEINEQDMYVTLECGVTWNELYEALKAKGLRTPYFGTASGYSSTVGGALSQNSTHFASVEFGMSADAALGITVVLADGTIVTTGSGSQIYEPTPFFRNFGPDMTGLFLGDTGAFGFKVRATLRLIPFPQHQRYASFAFDNLHSLMRSMGQVGRNKLAAECGGWDPAMVAGFLARSPSMQQDLKYLRGVLRSSSSLLEGLKDATRIAVTGRRAFKDVNYLMHVTIDEFSGPAADEKLKAIEKIAADEGGKSVEPTFPRAHRAIPFNYPNGILGPTGKRWSPTHGLAPHSRALQVADAMHKYFDDNAAEMEKYGVEWCLIMSAIYNNAMLIEPMMYWPDKRNAFHERWIEKDFLKGVEEYPSRPEVAEFMKKLRGGLMELFMKNGCSHLQIGKLYRYREGREPNTYDLLEKFKDAVDPKRLMNPGSLGLE